MDRNRRDIVIRCDHATRGGRTDLVQRFTWDEDQARWVYTRDARTRMTWLHGDEVDTWTIPEGEHGTRPLRVHLETTCRCRNSVAAEDDSLQEVFGMLCMWSDYDAERGGDGFRQAFALLPVTSDDQSVTITLDSLRHALKLRRMLLDP